MASGNSAGAQEAYPPLGEGVQSFRAPEPIANLAWSPDQRSLVGANRQDNTVYLWDLESGREIWRTEKARGAGNETDSLAFTPDGSAILTSFVGGGRQQPEAALSLLSARNGELIRNVLADRPARGWNKSRNFSIDRDSVAVVLGGSGRIGIFETKGWSLIRTIGPVLNQHGEPVGIKDVALDSSRDLVSVGWGMLGGAVIQTWSLSDNKKLAEFKPYSVSGITAMVMDRPGGRLITGGSMTVTWPKGEGAEAGPPDFSKALQDDHKKLVRGWDPRSGHLEMVYAGPEAAQGSLSISPNGRWLAAASGGPIRENKGYLLVWNLRTGELLGARTHGDNNIDGVSFSPDGRKLAYAVESRIYILSLPSGVEHSAIGGAP